MRLLHRLNRRFLLRYRLEYVLALLVVHGVRALSPAFAWGAARTLGRLLFRLGVRRRAMRANLALAFPGMSARERDDLARRTMEHFCSVCVDILFQRRLLRAGNLFRHVTPSGWARDYLLRHGPRGAREKARRILFLTGHMGNWELASGYFGLLGVPIAPVFRTPQNPFLARLLKGIRLDSQASFIERRGAVQSMLDHFDAGGNVGFLADQEAAFGFDVPFFGQPARTHKTPAVLARDHDVRIFFGVMVRKGDFLRYEAEGELLDTFPRTQDREEDLRAITADLLGRLEARIREHPDQYLWMHRRWKRLGVHGGTLA